VAEPKKLGGFGAMANGDYANEKTRICKGKERAE